MSIESRSTCLSRAGQGGISGGEEGEFIDIQQVTDGHNALMEREREGEGSERCHVSAI